MAIQVALKKTVRALFRRFAFPLVRVRAGQPFSLKGWWWSVRAVFHDPSNLAYFMGVRDFWLGRFGNCPDVVRVLAKEWSSRRS